MNFLEFFLMKYIYAFFISIWIFTYSKPLLGQINTGKHAISLEIYGISELLSCNYHRVLSIRQHSVINGRIGLGLSSFGFPNIPHGVTYCRGSSKNFLELGIHGSLGPTSLGYADAKSTIYVIAPMVGYRHHPGKGFLLQLYISPLIPISGNLGIKPTFGLGGGYVFGSKN